MTIAACVEDRVQFSDASIVQTRRLTYQSHLGTGSLGWTGASLQDVSRYKPLGRTFFCHFAIRHMSSILKTETTNKSNLHLP